MADAIVEGSPLWWVKRLSDRLARRRTDLETLENYYDGKHRLAFASPKFRETFGGLFREFADNWCDLVVDAVEERLDVEGFRFGEDLVADGDAWRMWQANSLDVDSQIGHTEAFVCSEASVLVWYNGPAGEPAITVEHPREMIVATAPGNPRHRLAALKVWLDDDGYEMATLYLPAAVFKFRSRTKRDSSLIVIDGGNVSGWEPREVNGEDWPLENPLGYVPVFPLRNRPRLLKPPTSEIRKVIPIQDGINKLVADMLVASEYAAYPQRWATGFDVPRDPDTGEPIKAFESAISRLWATTKDGHFGQFEAADLSNYTNAIETLVQHVASQTRTPPHYFYLSGNFPSGESIKSAEAGLVSKSLRKTRVFGETWEDVMRCAFDVKGDRKKAGMMSAETVWRDVEVRSDAERVDAAAKKQALGVPWEQIMEDLGYSSTQVERFKLMRRREALEQASLATEAGMLLDLNGGVQDPEVAAKTMKMRADAAAVLFRSGYDPEQALLAVGLDPIDHTGALPVTLQEQ